MCIISACPKGTKKDTEELYQWIRNGAETNSMGSGYAWKKDKETKIYLSKGYFDVEKMIDDIKSAKLGDKDELVIHHRIATSGKDVFKNTHPFVVDFDFESITMMQGFTDKPVVAHNGMFASKYGEGIDKEYNDTVHWIHIYLSNPHLLAKLKENPQGFYDKHYAELTDLSYNKLTFIFPDIGMIMMGHYEEAEGGYYHSNSCYKNTRHSDRGGVGSNLPVKRASYLESKLDFNSVETCSLKPHIKFLDNNGDVPGYSEIIKTIGEEQVKVTVVNVDEKFLKLKESNYHMFNFINPISGTTYFIDPNAKQAEHPNILSIVKWTKPNEKCFITFDDLVSYKRRVKATYLSVIRDVKELNVLCGNLPSKNKRKKLEARLLSAKVNKVNNISLKGTVRMVCPVAIELYLNNHKPDKQEQRELQFSETKSKELITM